MANWKFWERLKYSPDAGLKNEKSFMQGIMTQRQAAKLRNDFPQCNFGLWEGAPFFQPYGVQLSQADTLFKNNRWYLISNMRQLINEVYAEHGLIQTITDVPVNDALRGGIDIRSQQLSPEQIEELQVYVDRENILNAVVGQANKWRRLFGGAGILKMTDQDPTEPFDIKAIRTDSPLEFRAVDMWELFWDKQNTEGYDPEIQEHHYEYYSYYATKLHHSRVLKMKGLTPPSFIRPRLRGWGLSILEPVVRSVNQYLKSTDLAFQVLDEFKLDVYKFQGLASIFLSPEGQQEVMARVQSMNRMKNYQNATVLDEHDDFMQKQLSFTGIAETMKEIRMQIACDLRMPLTKIFGVSASGFNSGEDDIENYNAMIESEIRAKCKYDILEILEIISQKLFGMVPDDLQIEFKPLRVLSAEQEENVKTQQFNRLIMARDKGYVDDEYFINACNKNNLLPLDVELSDMDSLNDEEDEATTGSNDPAGNMDDSRKTEARSEYGGDDVKDTSRPATTIKTTVSVMQPKDADEPKESKGVKNKK